MYYPFLIRKCRLTWVIDAGSLRVSNLLLLSCCLCIWTLMILIICQSTEWDAQFVIPWGTTNPLRSTESSCHLWIDRPLRKFFRLELPSDLLWGQTCKPEATDLQRDFWTLVDCILVIFITGTMFPADGRIFFQGGAENIRGSSRQVGISYNSCSSSIAHSMSMAWLFMHASRDDWHPCQV